MRVVDQGTSPNIAFVPGSDSPAEGNLHLINELSDSSHCITYDPRGIPGTRSPYGP